MYGQERRCKDAGGKAYTTKIYINKIYIISNSDIDLSYRNAVELPAACKYPAHPPGVRQCDVPADRAVGLAAETAAGGFRQ